MKKLNCVICGRYRKFEKPKILYILEKTLLFYTVFSKRWNEDEKILEEEESFKILKILGLIENIWLL